MRPLAQLRRHLGLTAGDDGDVVRVAAYRERERVVGRRVAGVERGDEVGAEGDFPAVVLALWRPHHALDDCAADLDVWAGAVELEVSPLQRECLADPQAGRGEESEQQSVASFDASA